MRVGFTGTRHGMTTAQWNGVWVAFHQLHITELHHGDCIGADAQAHLLAQHMGIRIVIHPPADSDKRAWCQGAHEVREPRGYFERNRCIVDETIALVGTPLTDRQQPSGGTWYTLVYGSKMGTQPIVVWPDGRLEQRLWAPMRER